METSCRFRSSDVDFTGIDAKGFRRAGPCEEVDVGQTMSRASYPGPSSKYMAFNSVV